MKLYIFLFGLKRNGTHAIGEWIMGHWAESYPELYEHPQQYRVYINDVGKKYGLDFPPPLKLSWDKKHSDADAPFRIMSYESVRHQFLMGHRIEGEGRFVFLTVLRDAYNFLASFMEEWPHTSPPINRWVDSARFFYIGNVIDYFPINYNKWFIDQEYRRTISRHIRPELNGGAEFSDIGLNRVRMVGSSFDKRAYDRNAQEMKVLNRWKQFQEEHKTRPLYRKYLQYFLEYSELSEYTKEIFGMDMPEPIVEDLRAVACCG